MTLLLPVGRSNSSESGANVTGSLASRKPGFAQNGGQCARGLFFPAGWDGRRVAAEALDQRFETAMERFEIGGAELLSKGAVDALRFHPDIPEGRAALGGERHGHAPRVLRVGTPA